MTPRSLSLFSDETPPLSPSTRSSIASSNSSLSLPKSYSDTRLPYESIERDSHSLYRKPTHDSAMFHGAREGNIEEELDGEVEQGFYSEDRGRSGFVEHPSQSNHLRPGMPRQGSYSKRHSSFDTPREVPFPYGYLASAASPLIAQPSSSVLHERSSSVPAVSPGSDPSQQWANSTDMGASSSALTDSTDGSARGDSPPNPPRRPNFDRSSSSSLPPPSFTPYSTLPSHMSPASPPCLDTVRAPPLTRPSHPNRTEATFDPPVVSSPRVSSLKPPMSKPPTQFDLSSPPHSAQPPLPREPSPPFLADEADGTDLPQSNASSLPTLAPPLHDHRLHNSLPPPPKFMSSLSFASTSTARPMSLPPPVDNNTMHSSVNSSIPPPQPPTVLTPPLPLSDEDQNARTPAPYEPFLPRDQLQSDHTYIAVETMPAEYRLIVRLPGFQRDSITLAMRRRRILHVVADSWSDGGGHFERRISFGYDAELASVRAEFDGEILRIIVPRREPPGWYTNPTN